MSVPSQVPYNIYTANGQTTVFPYEFYIIDAGDIQVSINGTVVTTGYTVSGVGNVDGGNVTFLTPPASGSVVMLERVVPTFRLTDYQDNGDLLADTVNKDFDRIWMAIQRGFIDIGLALTRPLFGGPFNATGYRIANLADPVNDQDAATKKWVIQATETNLGRALRVPSPETYIPELASISTRSRMLLGFNNVGRPVPIATQTDTADLAIKLASTDGTDLIGLFTGGTVTDAIQFLTPEMFFNVSGDMSVIIQTCANYAKSSGLPVIASGDYLISGIIVFDSIKWRGGTIRGNNKYDAVQLVGADVEGVTFAGSYVHITKAGNTRFYKNKLHGQRYTAALFIRAFDQDCSVDVCFNEFWDCNYAILQQGGAGDGIVLSGRYSFNHIHDIYGDAIELNVVQRHYKNGLVIEGNIISNVDSTGANGGNNGAWGIGIGIAGQGPYGVDQTDEHYVGGFVIRNNHITRCRQCIHVELGRDFTIENNYVWPVSTVSNGAGLYTAGVAIYGSRRFTIDGITGETDGIANRMILIEWGVNNGSTYAGPPTDFTLRNINTFTGDIEVATAGGANWTNSTVIENSRCVILKWRGLPSESIFRNLSVQKIDCIGVHDASEGSGGGIYSRPFYTYTNWSNTVCLNAADSLTYASFAKLYVDRIDQMGNNFLVPTDMLVPGNRGPKLISQTEHYLLDDDEIAGGREFSQGTLLMKPSGGYFLVTKGGAFISQNGDYADRIRATVAGQTYIEAVNKDWSHGAGAKAAGCRIVIPGAGAGGSDLTTTIIRGAHIINSQYRCDISPGIVTATPTDVIIRALYPMEYVEVSNNTDDSA